MMDGISSFVSFARWAALVTGLMGLLAFDRGQGAPFYALTATSIVLLVLASLVAGKYRDELQNDLSLTSATGELLALVFTLDAMMYALTIEMRTTGVALALVFALIGTYSANAAGQKVLKRTISYTALIAFLSAVSINVGDMGAILYLRLASTLAFVAVAGLTLYLLVQKQKEVTTTT